MSRILPIMSCRIVDGCPEYEWLLNSEMLDSLNIVTIFYPSMLQLATRRYLKIPALPAFRVFGHKIETALE
jgi:hypothetical protein